MTQQDSPQRLIGWAIFTTIASILLVWVMYLARRPLVLLYVSAMLAIGFSPMVSWLERRRKIGGRRRRLPRSMAILILYIGILGTIALMLWIVLPPFMAQAGELWTRLPAYIDMLQAKLVSLRLIDHRWTWSELLRRIPSPGGALGGILGALQGVLGVAAAVLTVLLIPYYMLVEADMLRDGLLRLVPPARRTQVTRIADGVTSKVGAWLRGQLLLSFVIGSTAAIGLWFLDVPYFYVLALLAAIGELIPVVGPIIAAIPAVLVAGTVSPQTMVFVALYFAVQQFLENNILVPRIMERQVGVSAVTVLAALLIGTELLGVIGALLAVPTAAILQVFLQEYLDERERA